MADRVPKIRDADKPTTDAKAFSDRLQETRLAEGALGAVSVFDKTKPSSIVSLATYVRGKATDTINALTEFTAAHEVRLNQNATKLANHEVRLDQVEAQLANQRAPFGSASG